MLFVIFCLDRPEHEAVRLQHYEAHKAYLANASHKTIMSGPLVTDDDKTMIGSFFLVEAEDRQALERFVANDPFNQANIWRQIEIRAFRKRVG
ncbi:MAG: YciI family protein [Verrucomicrobia bacterium]|nr:YciI family protein [Verrucomicrobiota bacterium]MBV8486049.1 YciI family protein [Verrucomicrobiota bacterium]